VQPFFFLRKCGEKKYLSFFGFFLQCAQNE
jgi:hypothetical protein